MTTGPYYLAGLKRVAAKHGASVEDDSGGAWRVYQCVAPAGKHWHESNGPHSRRVAHAWRLAATPRRRNPRRDQPHVGRSV